MFRHSLCALALLATLSVSQAFAAQKYTLLYKFHPSETVRWEVMHRTKVRTTVSGTTQLAETSSKSVKAWRVEKVLPDGSAIFEHSVENVDMRQKLSGRSEVRYNSLTDKEPPQGFEHLAQSVNTPLSLVTMDKHGKIVHRERKRKSTTTQNEQGQMTIPLPKKPVAVGETWSFPYDVAVNLDGGAIKKIKTLQTFKLTGVKTGVATIHVATQVLSPVSDPAIEAKLIQRESSGDVRFDITKGRIISQQMDLDKGVVGFRGEASSVHYLTRFAEKLLPVQIATVARPPTRIFRRR
jgi:hypothetical protein